MGHLAIQRGRATSQFQQEKNGQGDDYERDDEHNQVHALLFVGIEFFGTSHVFCRQSNLRYLADCAIFAVISWVESATLADGSCEPTAQTTSYRRKVLR